MVYQPSRRRAKERRIERVANPEPSYASVEDLDSALDVLEEPPAFDDYEQPVDDYDDYQDDDLSPPALAEENPDDDDPDSDLGGGNGRGRISRISCR